MTFVDGCGSGSPEFVVFANPRRADDLGGAIGKFGYHNVREDYATFLWRALRCQNRVLRRIYGDDVGHWLLTDDAVDVPGDVNAAMHVRKRPMTGRLMHDEIESWNRFVASRPGSAAVFLDPDMLPVNRMPDLESAGFDVAITVHPDSRLRHPVNAGFLWVSGRRAPQPSRFLAAVANRLAGLNADHQRWFGDQQAITELCRLDAFRGRVFPERIVRKGVAIGLLPCRSFNFWFAEGEPIRDLGPERDRYFVHFKGDQKHAFFEYYERFVRVGVP